jgi:hypothetical protein
MKITQAHQIASVEDDTWTLILVGRRRRTWGFWTPEGWVDWLNYERLTPSA